METKSIFITGSLNTDLVIRSPYIPAAGETVTGDGFMTVGGGKGANQATAAAKLGGRVRMCGAVGADPYGKLQLDALARIGVDTTGIQRVVGTPTGTAVIILTGGNNRIILDKGANAALTGSDIDTFLSGARIGDIYLTQLENPLDVVGYGLAQAKLRGLSTILNPAPASPDIAAYFPWVDIIVPNETELDLLGGRDALFAAGCHTVITTLGARGYEIADADGVRTYPCICVDAVDTTAAGDTFCGGLAVGLAEGMSLTDACALGSRAASIACTRYGAQPSIPTREETENWRA